MKDLRRLLPLFGEYRRDLFLAMGFVLIETFFELVIPVLMADLIDVGSVSRSPPSTGSMTMPVSSPSPSSEYR